MKAKTKTIMYIAIKADAAIEYLEMKSMSL